MPENHHDLSTANLHSIWRLIDGSGSKPAQSPVLSQPHLPRHPLRHDFLGAAEDALYARHLHLGLYGLVTQLKYLNEISLKSTRIIDITLFF
mgnify:CR=1 FL=1